MQRKIEGLRPHPLNAEIYTATHDMEELMHSISEVGVLEPIVILKDGTIISGHRRVEACRVMGWDKVPVRVLEISKKDEPAHLVDFNKYRNKTATEILNEVGTLRKFYGDRRMKGVRTDTNHKGKKTRTLMSERLGIPETTIAKLEKINKHRPNLIPLVDSGEITIDHAYRHLDRIMRVEEYKENIQKNQKKFRRKKIVEGDSFRLFCKSSANMEEIEDGSVQTIFTSPPFWNQREYFAKGQIGTEDTMEDHLEAILPVFDECFRVLRDDGSAFFELGDHHTNGSLNSYPHKLLFAVMNQNPWFHQNTLIWRKTNFMRMSSSTRRWCPGYSFVFFLTKTSNSYVWNNEAIQERSVTAGKKPRVSIMDRNMGNQEKNSSVSSRTGITISSPFRMPSDVIEAKTSDFAAEKETGIKIHHPAMYSEELVQGPLLATSNPGDLVLDPFTGCSTTGVVAVSHGRKYVGYDLNPEFIEVGRRRMTKREVVRKSRSAGK